MKKLPRVAEPCDVLPVNGEAFRAVMRQNRLHLRGVESWMDRATWEASLWNFGVPERCLMELDQIPGDVVTYSDILVFLAAELSTTHYLEIGVSAGRNFVQMLKSLCDWRMVGLDIEGVPPFLSANFEKTIARRSTKPFRFRSKNKEFVPVHTELIQLSSSITNNSISIVRGDKFRDETWAYLQGNEFALVFSDACHVPRSLSTEVAFLLEHQLLSRKHLIMIWDDIHKAQEAALVEVVAKLDLFYGDGRSALHLFNLRGTYGPRRRVALYTSDQRLLPR